MLCTVKAQEKISLKGLSKKEINAIKKEVKEKKRIAKLQAWGLINGESMRMRKLGILH